jgi:hypothetical protein
MELRVGKKYRLSKKIGGGSFGDIFHGAIAKICFENFVGNDMSINESSVTYRV